MGLRIKSSQSLGHKIATLMAVFALVFQPVSGFVAGQLVSALEVVNGDTARIYNAADLAEAAANPTIKNLSIKASFSTSDKTVFNRNVNLDGNNNTITFNGTANWHGEYVFQVYKASGSFKNVTITGGDAAIYANGSTVNLQGNVDVSGNEFGGIEVSQGDGVTTPAVLNVGEANLINGSEVNTKPTAWIDDASTAEATVSGPFTETTHIGTDQKQYYLNPANTGTVATNVTQGTTYADAQTAVDQVTPGDVVRLDQDVTLVDRAVRITKSLTLDGDGKTITAPFVRGTQGGVNNTTVSILTSGVIVKNLTTVSTNTTNPAHGVNVQGSAHLDNVTLQNIKTVGATAGVILNNSTVSIDGITTTGSDWYGVGVDKGTHLTIKGNNTHAGAVQGIKNDNTTTSTVTDVDGQYVLYDLGGNKSYYAQGDLKLVSPQDGAVVKGDILTNSWTDAPNAVKYIYESYNSATATESNLRWRETLTTTSKTATNVSESTFWWRVTAVDAADNRTEPTGLWKITVDNTAPVANVSYNPSGLTNQDVVVTITANEAVQDVAAVGWIRQGTSNKFTKVFSANGKESITVVDLAGNSTTVKVDVKRIDKTNPVIDGVSNGDVRNSNLPSFTVTDQNFDQYLGGVKVNGNNVTCTPPSSGWTWTCPGISGDGTYIITARDKANNSTSVTFRIDTTPSTVTAFANNPARGELNAILSGTVSDAARYQWTYVGADGRSVEFSETNQLTTGVYVLAYGTYNFVLTAWDEAGNESRDDVQVVFRAPVGVNKKVDPIVNVQEDTPIDDDDEESNSAASFLNPGIVAVLDDQNTNANDDEGDVLAEEDNAQDNNTQGEVLADEDEVNDGCAKFLGLCWYWWIPIVLAVVLVGWIIRGMLREDDDLPPARRQ